MDSTKSAAGPSLSSLLLWGLERAITELEIVKTREKDLQYYVNLSEMTKRKQKVRVTTGTDRFYKRNIKGKEKEAEKKNRFFLYPTP